MACGEVLPSAAAHQYYGDAALDCVLDSSSECVKYSKGDGVKECVVCQ
jgi:hypothetical protein